MRNNVIAKVKKMLAKADPSSNNFIAEIEMAAEKAKGLIAKHKITQAELDAHDSLNKDGLAEKEAYYGKLALWAESLAVAVEKITGTRALCQHRRSDPEKKRVVFIGSNDSVDMAIELFNKFFWIISDRAEQSAGGCGPAPGWDLLATIQAGVMASNFPNFDKQTSVDSYSLGFAHKLLVRADRKVKMETDAAQQKYEIMVVEENKAIAEYIKEKYNPPEPKPVPINHGDRSAYLKGYLDAEQESLNINKAIK